MESKTTDNTRISNGILKDDLFFPKVNLQSGTIRLVLTTDCNFKCKYCFAEGEKDKKHRVLEINKLKEILIESKNFGITAIKLTGGEPLLYPYLEELLAFIRDQKFKYVDLTTNISMLNEYNINLLNKYGVNAITLSLNSLDPNRYTYLTGFNDVDKIWENMNNTIKQFKGLVRINSVVFDYNFDVKDYDSILEFSKKNNVGLRFVEPSKVENYEITQTKNKFIYYTNYLKEKCDKVIKSDCESVEYLFFEDWYLTIMHSLCDNKLCDTCKKYMYLRVTSEKKLKPCLSRRDTETKIDFNNINKSFIDAISKMGVGIE